MQAASTTAHKAPCAIQAAPKAQHYQTLTLRFPAGGTKISSKPWHQEFMLDDLHPSLAKEVSWFCCQENSI